MKHILKYKNHFMCIRIYYVCYPWNSCECLRHSTDNKPNICFLYYTFIMYFNIKEDKSLLMQLYNFSCIISVYICPDNGS